MTRRLRMAGTAFGAFFVPACMTMPAARTPDAPKTPAAPVGVAYRPMPGALAQAQKKPREQFATGREEATTTLTAGAAIAGPGPKLGPTPPPTESPLVPKADPLPAPTAPPLTAEPPRLPAPLLGPPVPAAEPATDAEGVIRPPKPVIPGAPPVAQDPVEAPTPPIAPIPSAGPALPPAAGEPGAKPGVPAMLIPPAVGPAPVLAIPPAGGPVIGSSVHEAKASPISPPATEVPAEPIAVPPAVADTPPTPPGADTPPTPADSPLLRAVRAFQANRPEEAVGHLQPYDPMTQQVLLALMPAMVRLTDGRLQQMKPEEMDLVLDQLGKVTPLLRPRASLQATNVRLCREVHTFAHVEGYADNHVFRPGDVVHLYMELANYTSVPDGRGGYTIELSSSLELRDGGNGVVWRADPKDVPDRVSTPPQDYYRAFRLAVPNVPPGAYTLAVKTTDRPSGREVRKSVDVRIGSK